MKDVKPLQEGKRKPRLYASAASHVFGYSCLARCSRIVRIRVDLLMPVIFSTSV